jgi:short subunit dehydrogenase-like uncharacterized protein
MISMTTPFLLYGSYGYTGSLIADLAVKQGVRPILSGRDPVRLRAQAEALGLEYRPISLEDSPVLESALKEVVLGFKLCGSIPSHIQTSGGCLSEIGTTLSRHHG